MTFPAALAVPVLVTAVAMTKLIRHAMREGLERHLPTIGQIPAQGCLQITEGRLM